MGMEIEKIKVKVKRLHPEAALPAYAHVGRLGDLAADLRSIESIKIEPGQVYAIRTGLAIELPQNYGAVIEDRSGLSLKGLTTLAGVVDSGYRGEIKVVLANVGTETISIRNGERIAQFRIVRRIEAAFEEVERLSDSERNTKGFGSSGL
jgi:dUTP pyrophosphatase